MKSIGRLLVGLLLLANLLFLVSLSLHVVRWPGGWAVVSKSQLTLLDTYADTRNWSKDDLAARTSLVSRIVQSGESRTISHVTPVGTVSAETAAISAGSVLFDMTKK